MSNLYIVILLILFWFPLYAQDIKSNNNPTHFDYDRVTRKLTNVNNFQPQKQLKSKKDSFSIKKVGQNIWKDIQNTSGQIDVGASYGLNTLFTDTARGIASTFSTSGSFNTGILNLPVQVSFNYSTLKIPLGANNYFRISFDKRKYLEQQKEKLTGQVSNIENLEQKIGKKKSVLTQLQGYTEVYLDMLYREIQRESERLIKENKQKAKDSISNGVQDKASNYSGKGKKTNKSAADSLSKYKNNADRNLEKIKTEYDSIQKIYQKIQSAQKKYDTLKTYYETYKQKLENIKGRLEDPDIGSLGSETLDKTSFLKSIQKVDIGLTYPKTTALSSQNTAIKGIGTEFQYKQYYLSLSAGLTLNNTMMSTDEISNQLNNNQNSFNQFDFQQVKENGFLTAIKTGLGTPDGSHVFVGFNYLTNTHFLGSNMTSNDVYDPAASVELDLRYVPTFYKGGALDVVYGKTSANRKLDTIEQRGVFSSLFSKYRSNTFLTKYTQNIPVLRSDVSIQFRSIDPYANTTVYGNMQPGNRRIELKTNHRISSYFRFGTTYKIDEAYGYESQLRLQSVGLNISGSYTSYFAYSAMVNHVDYASKRPSGEQEKGTSYLYGINLQSNYELTELAANTELNYNDYLFSDTVSAVKYTQFGIKQTIGNRTWSTIFKYDYFFQSSEEISTGTSVLGIGMKYSMKKVKIDGGIDIATEMTRGSNLGGHLEIGWQVSDFMNISFRGERFVMGNFYRNYYRSLYNRFPYLFSIKTAFTF